MLTWATWDVIHPQERPFESTFPSGRLLKAEDVGPALKNRQAEVGVLELAGCSTGHGRWVLRVVCTQAGRGGWLGWDGVYLMLGCPYVWDAAAHPTEIQS